MGNKDVHCELHIRLIWAFKKISFQIIAFIVIHAGQNE